jgi:hypothetical protein
MPMSKFDFVMSWSMARRRLLAREFLRYRRHSMPRSDMSLAFNGSVEERDDLTVRMRIVESSHRHH